MSASVNGQSSGTRTSPAFHWLGGCLIVLMLSGCRHRQAPPTLPAILKAPDVQPPTPEPPTMEIAPPASLSDVPAVKVTEAKPKRRPRKASAKLPEATSPDAAAPTPPSEISHLGELSAGGDSDPKNQQEASDIIASTTRRLDALLKMKGGKPQTQVAGQTREVRRFLQQAREALGTSDAEGARTLATKAKLLMDDLEKWTQQ